MKMGMKLRSQLIKQRLIVEMPSNQTSVRIKIQTLQDDIDEPNGGVVAKVIVTDSDNYRLVDHEREIATTPVINPNLDRLSSVAMVQVLDDDPVPEISISAISSSVVEGTDAQFSISANRQSQEDVVIPVEFSDGDSNFIGTGTLDSVTITSG